MRGWSIAIVIALAAPAAAEPRAASVGPWFSALGIDHFSGVAVGAGTDLWLVRRGSVAFGVDGELGRVWLLQKGERQLQPSIAGSMARAGADARWTVGAWGSSSDFGIDLWLQAGLGVHAMQWDRGGRLIRPDAQGGFGITERFGDHKRYGMDAGFLLSVGHGAGGGLPRCAGPCDEPTPPVHDDILFFEHLMFWTEW